MTGIVTVVGSQTEGVNFEFSLASTDLHVGQRVTLLKGGVDLEIRTTGDEGVNLACIVALLNFEASRQQRPPLVFRL